MLSILLNIELLKAASSKYILNDVIAGQNNPIYKLLLTQRFELQDQQPRPSQETEVTSTPTRPIENVVITTKGLQDRNIHILDGTTVENKGKLILVKIILKLFSILLLPI